MFMSERVPYSYMYPATKQRDLHYTVRCAALQYSENYKIKMEKATDKPFAEALRVVELFQLMLEIRRKA